MPKKSWSEFFRTLVQQGYPSARIIGMWNQYASTGKLPQGVNLNNPRNPTTPPTPAPVGRIGEQTSPSQGFVGGAVGTPMVGGNIGPSIPPSSALGSTISPMGPNLGTSYAPTSPAPGMASIGPSSGLAILQHNASNPGTFGVATVPSQGYGTVARQDPISGGMLPEQTVQAARRGNIQELPSNAIDNIFKGAGAPPTPNFGYQDFTGQANSITAQNYQPQYDALNLATQNAQGQYNRADPIIAGLYSKLAADTAAQAQQTGTAYGNAAATRQQQGTDLTSGIANNYNSTQNNQAALLAKLGIQDAAPQTLQPGTNNSAWQQGQANIGTQQQMDYMNNAGRNAKDYQNNISTAQSTQGAVARQDLIAQLSGALSQIDQSRLGVASSQSQAATDLGLTLSDRNYGQQKDVYSAAVQARDDAINQAMQQYGLHTNVAAAQYAAQNNAFDQQIKSAQLQIEARKAQYAGMPPILQGTSMMTNNYDNPQTGITYGTDAMDAALSVAATNAPKTTGEFIQAVIAQAAAKHVPQAIAIEAANQVLPTMNYGRMTVPGTYVTTVG